MSSDKYAALDAAIIKSVSAGESTFSQLMAGQAGYEARELQAYQHSNASRVLDSRLQELRKAGKIKRKAGKIKSGGRSVWVLAQEGGAA